ncbi:DNA primase [Tissierella praeacuta]|uniref:CHC2 zinc finger domain-containing protein n=1 Tax=Tissierella praeacuta TaxID=43131 RepID=UPI00104C0B0B|nr:CHC2 zinc finger domain-containing protein [Tissierella praeacuta]TCU79343.1 DNA primase [Tissierella praeacuta]
MNSTLDNIITKKTSHDVGVLIFQYLNDIEPLIQESLTASKLKDFYGLKGKYSKGRFVCPFHAGADNPTSLSLNDKNKNFHCNACSKSGTYLEFVMYMQNLSGKNSYNEAKIFVANNLVGLNLGFTSIADFEQKLKDKILERYRKTNSLKYVDYYSIWLLPEKYLSTTVVSQDKQNKMEKNQSKPSAIASLPTSTNNINFMLDKLDLETTIRHHKAQNIIDNGITDYDKAIQNAKNSKLISDFTQNIDKLNSTDKLSDFMSKKYNIDIDTAMKYGLIYLDKDSQKQLHYSDFFMLNNRVLFPVRDHETGIIVGYQCRQTDLNAPKRYKYLNITDYQNNLTTNKSGTTFRDFVPYKPGNFLFNLYELKDKSTNIKTLWITEGIADAIKLSSMEYDAISSGQANLTDSHIYLIDKYFGKDVAINLFFDNDEHKVGQNKSIAVAYRLWQFGFRNIRIIRTYKELGKDITDCSVKLLDDDTLRLFINLWEKQAYSFTPANNEDLNTLLKTSLYTENEIVSIDPRNIKQVISFAEILAKYVDLKNMNYKQLTVLKKLYPLNEEENKILLNLFPKDYHEVQDVDETETAIKENNNNNNMDNGQEEKNVEENLINISKAQLFHLKKKFDINLIQKIDNECSKKQIAAIIGNIIRNKNFDVWNYIPKSHHSTIDIAHGITIQDDDNDIPF